MCIRDRCESAVSSVESNCAACCRDLGRSCTLRRRCSVDEYNDVSLLSRASTLGTRRIARRMTALRTSATECVATQSRQAGCSHALPRQRLSGGERNFALYLPLVAYPTQAEYEQCRC